MKKNTPVSYQGLKCIMEYLEINKRCQLVANARHKSLNPLHKVIPKHANNVKIEELCVTINQCQHLFRFAPVPHDETRESFQEKIVEDPSAVMEFRLGPRMTEDENLAGFYIMININKNVRRVTHLREGSNVPRLISRLLCKYFEGKSATNIDILELGIGFIPVEVGISQKVKLAVKHLKIMDPEIEPAQIISILAETCIPLKECTVKPDDTHHLIFQNELITHSVILNLDNPQILSWVELMQILPNRHINFLNNINVMDLAAHFGDWKRNPRHLIFQNELITSSETLNLDMSQALLSTWLGPLRMLPNKHINVSGGLSQTVFALHEHWKSNPRPLGFTFTMRTCLVLEFSVWPTFATKAKIASRTCQQFPFAWTTPIGDNLELNIYGRSNPAMLVFEMMPRGSAVAFEEPKSGKDFNELSTTKNF